jgi:hypothetical protein
MDVHVRRAISVALRQRGVDVLTAQEDESATLPDSALLDRATVLRRVLFSQDEDLLAEATRRQKRGIAFGGVVYAHQLYVTVGTYDHDDAPKAAPPDGSNPGQSIPPSPRWLPRIGSPAYHVMLSAVAILILGPLGGISAAFMNFSIGFFVGGQVLAGILGSVVTLPYGPEGKHGANYMQTMAASVAGMCGMSALVQAMVWMGLPQPPMWQLVLYFMCIGMFGVGLGMLYTPILVDRLQLTYPSGLAVANILRALTDKELLKRSIFKLGGSMASGLAWRWRRRKFRGSTGCGSFGLDRRRRDDCRRAHRAAGVVGGADRLRR